MIYCSFVPSGFREQKRGFKYLDFLPDLTDFRVAPVEQVPETSRLITDGLLAIQHRCFVGSSTWREIQRNWNHIVSSSMLT